MILLKKEDESQWTESSSLDLNKNLSTSSPSVNEIEIITCTEATIHKLGNHIFSIQILLYINKR